MNNSDGLDMETISNIGNLIKESSLAFKSLENDDEVLIVVDHKNKVNEHLVVTIRLNVKEKGIAVNEILDIDFMNIQEMLSDKRNNINTVHTNNRTIDWLKENNLKCDYITQDTK